MSRNTQYQFISTDTNALVSALVSGYEKITGVSVQPASPEKLFIQWVADIIIQERVQNNYTGNQNIPSRASGENLDALGEHRRPADHRYPRLRQIPVVHQKPQDESPDIRQAGGYHERHHFAHPPGVHLGGAV